MGIAADVSPIAEGLAVGDLRSLPEPTPSHAARDKVNIVKLIEANRPVLFIISVNVLQLIEFNPYFSIR